MNCLVPTAPLGSTSSSGLANCEASIPSKLVTVWADSGKYKRPRSRTATATRFRFVIPTSSGPLRMRSAAKGCESCRVANAALLYNRYRVCLLVTAASVSDFREVHGEAARAGRDRPRARHPGQRVIRARYPRTIGGGRGIGESSSPSVIRKIHGDIRHRIAVLIFHRHLQRFRQLRAVHTGLLVAAAGRDAGGRSGQRSFMERRCGGDAGTGSYREIVARRGG